MEMPFFEEDGVRVGQYTALQIRSDQIRSDWVGYVKMGMDLLCLSQMVGTDTHRTGKHDIKCVRYGMGHGAWATGAHVC